MRNVSKSYSINLTALFFFFLIFTSSTAFALQETRLTQNGSRASSPAIYGDNVVWSDYVNDSGIVHLYNLTTSEDIQLNSSSASWPAIYGNKVVWVECVGYDDNYDCKLVIYDIPTAKRLQIAKNVSEDSIPAIYENKIVWHYSENGNSNVYMYDLSTFTKCKITTSKDALYPAIYADRIVWTDYRNKTSNIYMYNLSTSKETQITDSELPHLNAAIYGDNIVWEGDRGGRRYSVNPDIYMYNISTSKVTQITNSESASRPKIYKDNIIWMDSRNSHSGSDIYMYNISMQEEAQIIMNGSTQNWPAIYEDRLVWQDWRNGNGYFDIYTCIVPTIVKSPIANFSVTPDVGFAPLSVQFTDFSRNSVTRSWDFNNDGIPESTEKNPVYVYTDPGNYTVNLTVSDANTTDSKLFTILVFPKDLVDNQLVLTETQISTGGEALYGSSPKIYEDKVVWQDSRNNFGNQQQTDDIYMYNISTKKEIRITTPTSGFSSGLDFYGDRIVSLYGRNGINIYMYNLSTSTEIQISFNKYTYVPSIHGDRIVWIDDRNGKGHIFTYNVSSSKETQVTTNESVPGELDIYGDRIVWRDYRNGINYENSNIYMYNLSTSKETQITVSGSAYNPKIYGDRIIWQDSRDEKSPIHMYNILNSTETQITIPSSKSIFGLDIYEDRLVYTDSRNGNYDIFMYNLSTQKEIQITTNKSNQEDPAIYGNRIVWRNHSKYGTDIYMCTISLKEPRLPVANLSTNNTSDFVP
jgi:beta propeller repeat protein